MDREAPLYGRFKSSLAVTFRSRLNAPRAQTSEWLRFKAVPRGLQSPCHRSRRCDCCPTRLVQLLAPQLPDLVMLSAFSSARMTKLGLSSVVLERVRFSFLSNSTHLPTYSYAGVAIHIQSYSVNCCCPQNPEAPVSVVCNKPPLFCLANKEHPVLNGRHRA